MVQSNSSSSSSFSLFESFRWVLVGGIILRVILLIYGEYQDEYYEVKYTDIDYEVFTDAARYVSLGKSPYLRSTYRYTPLLAILLTPNIWVHKGFGKVIFVLADLIVGILLRRIAKLRKVDNVIINRILALGWLWNPMVANISTRGNAESLLVLVILGSFHSFLTSRFKLGCILYGLSVHFKIYPIIYAVPLWFFINHHYPKQRNHLKLKGKRTKSPSSASNTTTSPPTTKVTSLLTRSVNYLDSVLPQELVGFFTRSRVLLALYSGGTFLLLNLIMYLFYGQEFIHHTYLYHVTRKDHRHNFSVWFYPIYLSATTGTSTTTLLGLATFLPQFLLTGYLGYAYSLDLFLACFLQTSPYDNFNKVSPSPYFMWYLGLLPLILASSPISFRWRGAQCLGLWILGQVLWLLPAYFLEFQGLHTFHYLWLASLLFYLINAHLLCQLLKTHPFQPLFQQGQIVPCRPPPSVVPPTAADKTLKRH